MEGVSEEPQLSFLYNLQFYKISKAEPRCLPGWPCKVSTACGGKGPPLSVAFIHHLCPQVNPKVAQGFLEVPGARGKAEAEPQSHT